MASSTVRNVAHACACKHARHRVSSRARLGTVTYTRAYCVCDACEFSCAPLDYALGIPPQGPSVERRELICHAATKDRSFEKARDTLGHHSHIHLSDEAIRKLAESQGRGLVEERARRVDACFANGGRVPDAPSRPVPLLVVVCDGGMVQTRDPDERWKTDKIGCVYDAQPHPDANTATPETYQGATALTKTYVATMEPWDTFARMLFAEACTRGYWQAHHTLFISDAGNGIVSLREEHFPDAVPIIDWYHAVEHLSDCAKAGFGVGTKKCKRWFERHRAYLWEGHVQKIIDHIQRKSRAQGPPPKGAPDTDPRVVLHRNVGYFTNHQDAMDYPRYRDEGWPIGSGVAEGSVKQFALRVKGSEQFWNLSGVEEMLALCELHFCEDDRWVKYWRERGAPPEDATILRARSPCPSPQHGRRPLST